jgi:hypothetical protein
MSTAPTSLFVGQGLGNQLMLVDSGITDGGVRFEVIAVSDPITPDGEGGESVFIALWLTITHSSSGRLVITPYVDGVTKPVSTWDLNAEDERVTETREVPINDVLYDTLDSSVELARFAPRGRRVWVKVECQVADPFLSVFVPGIAGGDLIFESIEVEYDKVQETQETV